MITIFNRREILVTRSAEEQLHICTLLNGLGIETRTVSGNLGTAGRYHGLPGIDWEAAYAYYVYVHKKDYARARQALNQA